MSENPSPTPDEIRVKQFEAELASRERLTAAADREIGRVWDAHAKMTKLAAKFIVFVGVLVAFIGVKTISDIKDGAKDAAKNAVKAEVEKVQGEVRTELNRQFAKEEIQKLITEKAKERIDLTAGPLVESLVRSNISSWITAASTRMAELNVAITDSEERLRAVKAGSDFILTVVKANNDDRAAYDRLGEFALDTSFLYRKVAYDAYFGIAESDASRNIFFTKLPLWKDSAVATKYQIQNYIEGYNTLCSREEPRGGTPQTTLRVKLIQELWDKNDLDKSEKFNFLMDVYKNDKSLKVISLVGRLVNKEPGADYLPLHTAAIIHWWDENKSKYQTGKTNVTK